MTGSRERNRSLERGIAILRAFRQGVSELGNADIADRTGLPKATVSRLTQTLVGAGLLERVVERRVYRLAPGILSIAHAMGLASPIHSAIAPLMRTEATRRRVNVGLAAADGDAMVYLESFRYSPQSSFRTVVSGQRIPIELTSLGRSYLWARPASARARELAQIAERRARSWPQLRDEIDASFEEVNAIGYCAVSWQPGVAAVATALCVEGLPPHALNMSLTSSDALGRARVTLGPWLLDLRNRCRAHLIEALELHTA